MGSQVIQTSIDYLDANAGVVKNKAWGDTSYGLRYNIPAVGGAVVDRVITYESEQE